MECLIANLISFSLGVLVGIVIIGMVNFNERDKK